MDWNWGEPNWGMVETLLVGGLAQLSAHISEQTQEMIYTDLDGFKFGEVYDLLAYIAKKHRAPSEALDEAGRMMGFLAAPPPSDPTGPPVTTARQVKFPCKWMFPWDWSRKRISGEVIAVVEDPDIPKQFLSDGHIRKDGVRGGVPMRVIYEPTPDVVDIHAGYPIDPPVTEQRNAVGRRRMQMETMLTASLEPLKEHLAPIDYEVNADLIDHGVYHLAIRRIRLAESTYGVATPEFQVARSLLRLLPNGA